MANLQLHPGISFALVGDQAIFLDLRHDRYVALDETAADAFAALRSDCGCSGEAAKALLETGLFERPPMAAKIVPAVITTPDRDLPDYGGRPALPDVLHVWALSISYRRAVRRQPIRTVIAKQRRLHADRTQRAGTATPALVQRFLRARALVPVKPVCLQDSLALRDWLAAHGAPSSLVLGVRLDPFAAHCWVQHGETVLNDAADRVAAYTPILVVE